MREVILNAILGLPSFVQSYCLPYNFCIRLYVFGLVPISLYNVANLCFFTSFKMPLSLSNMMTQKELCTVDFFLSSEMACKTVLDVSRRKNASSRLASSNSALEFQ